MQAQELLPGEIKRDAQYGYLGEECKRGLDLIHSHLGHDEGEGEESVEVLLETGEGSFGGFVGWRRLVPGWVGGKRGRGQGPSLA